ncbi:BRD4-interacting chromatin-remodeling complex-associated protein-like [Cynara cardunculus var. scolymus]|uniref:BRD4-interacting chromatin-remodeling complex-associated protein-like n=1 Tax=Cynara cardunculus var. scolymus TaxID=59895 RepID=UPI000D625214|nr:BRD4-interacting chromatin-remodeling complex-associated protein-like [Cynara cardunculus var. scolymus]
MEKAKALAQQQLQLQQQLLLQQQQQQHPQQQFLLLQQIQQQQAISRFPSNIDAHLRPPLRTIRTHLQPPQSPNPNHNHPQIPNSSNLQPNRLQHTSPANQAELQMAYQDAWRVCHPDFKRPFSSLEDACERLLPYHVVADYEAEEDDRLLDSDTTGQALSRSQQWDHNIANKVAEFTATFEKQVLAFNIISQKRAIGEFRSEERLLVEQLLLQEERRTLLEARAEMEIRQKAGREAQAASLRIAAMAQAEQTRAEMMARAPIRASALGAHEVGEQEQEVVPDEMMNGWGARDEKEPSEDFLNDEERENGDTGTQCGWREGGEFDLNTR